MRPLFHPSVENIIVEDILYALSDPVRVAIYANIAGSACAQTCSSFLNVSATSIPKSTLSRHFKILREAGLIRSERQGVEMHNTSRCAEVEQRFPRLLPAIVNAYNIQLAEKNHAGKVPIMTRKVHVSAVIQEAGRILLVQEAKQENRGLWNLPGGHLEETETVQQGALREVFEETGLHVVLEGLIGIYTTVRPGYQAFRFVFAAPHSGGEAFAGDDILAVQWVTPAEATVLSDGELVSPIMFRRILLDLERNPLTPLSLLVEP